MNPRPFRALPFWIGAAFMFALVAAPGGAVESFDRDPGWDALNNRPGGDIGVTREQAFGYSRSAHAGGQPGEIGGRVERTFTPAYYAKPIPEKTLNDRLEASGRFSVTQCDGGGVLVGWFNENSRGWRTPNSLSFRIDGAGGKYRVFFEYGTQHWKTYGEGPTGTGRMSGAWQRCT